MKILLVCAEHPATFWSGKHLLRLIGKRASSPPLGLLTVAAMLPKSWEKKLVDLNVCGLTDKDILWADYVFVGAMKTQKKSAEKVIMRCKELEAPVVVGGPILETGYEEFTHVTHLLLGEVEETLPEFLRDLSEGRAKRVYQPTSFPSLSASPIPLWSLINPKDYACITVQYSRGCPFNCAFCNIGALFGHKPRLKSPEQFIGELKAIHATGFKGTILIADDNPIGNKKMAKEMLHQLVEWQQQEGHPFEFTSEADITLADDEELMKLMVSAGIRKVFLGLETPNRASLIECDKLQNAGRDMVACVRKMRRNGLTPMSGFIVGFDADDSATFADQMIEFIQKTGIVTAMVGVLQAPPLTPLYERLKKEGRLCGQASGNNTDFYPNFIPKMPVEVLVRGYKRIVETIYSPREYYERIRVFLKEYVSVEKATKKMTVMQVKAFALSMWYIGLMGGLKTSYYYWKTLWFAHSHNPKALPEAVAFLIWGWHFKKIAEDIKKAEGPSRVV